MMRDGSEIFMLYIKFRANRSSYYSQRRLYFQLFDINVIASLQRRSGDSSRMPVLLPLAM